MIRVEHVETWGFDHAIRGMRNPMNSWAKSDSFFGIHASEEDYFERYFVGENDLDLMKRLFIGGSEHRKYLRQIFVSMDIIAPDYFFKEFSTYRIGVTENSTSTMHKIHAKEFTLDDFSHEHLKMVFLDRFEKVISSLNSARYIYLNWDNESESVKSYFNNDRKNVWWQMIQLLPMSYNYRRTVTMNYENVVNMIHQREFHKLDEWREFIEILRGLPYIEEIMKCEK